MTTAASGETTHTVALCIITYLRPIGLARLLAAIAALDTAGCAVAVVVVDNDPDGSAEAVVDAARAQCPMPILYRVESRRGIPQARNTAVATALGEECLDGRVDWIGWLDDDEAPRPDWLHCLVETQLATGADVVSGPSVPVFEGDVPAWIVEAGVFDSSHFATGAAFPFNHARTSGVIVRASAMPDEGFDDRLALSGGSDRVLFTLMHRAGHRFHWDDRAIVDEWIPASRASLGWLTKRWFRKGVTRSLSLVLLDQPSVARRARRMAGGVVMALRGVGETIWAARGGRSAALAAAPRILFGLGATYGATGRHFHEYRKTHGR